MALITTFIYRKLNSEMVSMHVDSHRRQWMNNTLMPFPSREKRIGKKFLGEYFQSPALTIRGHIPLIYSRGGSQEGQLPKTDFYTKT